MLANIVQKYEVFHEFLRVLIDLKELSRKIGSGAGRSRILSEIMVISQSIYHETD
jgi:hypothetical protein